MKLCFKEREDQKTNFWAKKLSNLNIIAIWGMNLCQRDNTYRLCPHSSRVSPSFPLRGSHEKAYNILKNNLETKIRAKINK